MSGATERTPVPLLVAGAGGPNRASDYLMASVLLTNATIRLSGDHEGTLMVPCPP